MVKYFDPTETDLTIRLIRKIQDIFTQRANKITESEGEKAIAHFFETDKKYSKIFDEFQKKNEALPKFVMKDDCQKREYVMSTERDYTYYKGHYNPAENKIILCGNLLTDMLELKENVDRELMMAYTHRIKKASLEDDESFVCSQWKACRFQYDNLANISEEMRFNLASDCTKYLTKVCPPLLQLNNNLYFFH